MVDFSQIKTPAFICDLGVLRHNLKLLSNVQFRSGCKILLALKAFSMWSTFPIIRKYLPGVSASSLYEAQLGYEQFQGEVHAYAPAYSEIELRELTQICDHIIFNNPAQRDRFKNLIQSVECGLRINPEHSEVETQIYDPCQRYSRLGVTRTELDPKDFIGFSGLHFHNLCEKDADALERTLMKVSSKFEPELRLSKWVNFGGGHLITSQWYDTYKLIKIIQNFKQEFDVEVYLEPGAAIAYNCGWLVASVLDIFKNEMPIAILDTSATAHMPDVIEMPYRPEIVGADKPGKYQYTYRLGGMTCLAGDIVGDYSFSKPLKIGDRIIFCDMAQYTMVKTNTFNGIRLPSIMTYDPETNEFELIKKFGYTDFRDRLS